MRALSLPLAQAIVHELAGRGPLGKTELVRATGASPMAVTNHLTALEEAGLVLVDAPTHHRAGRRVHYRADEVQIRAAVRAFENYLLPGGSNEVTT